MVLSFLRCCWSVAIATVGGSHPLSYGIGDGWCAIAVGWCVGGTGLARYAMDGTMQCRLGICCGAGLTVTVEG